jgi:LmbE family N-acetylglucosaminyl deacetylase
MPSLPPLLALGAHPDDIEFGCGGVIAKEAAAGRRCHFLILTRGESATHGTPAERAGEARAAAKILGATVQFLPLAEDARLKPRTEHAFRIAAVIRKLRPAILLAPSLVKNQHPDHTAVANLTQMAARYARYGGIKEAILRKLPAHAIGALFFYAITPGAEPADIAPILIDVSAPEIMDRWSQAMNAHATQMKTRNYVELQFARARVRGLQAGVQSAIALYPNDPLVLDSLAPLSRTARAF